MIGKTIPCPVEIVETGYVKIVGDNTNTKSLHANWEYKVAPYHFIERRVVGRAFEASKEEVDSWTQKQR